MKTKIKIRGLKKKTVQVTFDGKTHPTSGCVIEFNWNDLKTHLQNKIKDDVISIEITDFGLKVYHKTLGPANHYYKLSTEHTAGIQD